MDIDDTYVPLAPYHARIDHLRARERGQTPETTLPSEQQELINNTPVAERISGTRTYVDRVTDACVGIPSEISDVEADMYKAFIQAASSCAPSLLVSNSCARRSAASSSSILAPDVSFYNKTDFQVDGDNTQEEGEEEEREEERHPYPRHHLDFSTMLLFAEIKSSKESDPFIDDFNTNVGCPYPFQKQCETQANICGQIASYAAAISGSQYRSFGFCIGVFGEIARLFRWDASGITVSAAFDFRQTRHLAEFLWRFDDMSSQDRGYDSSVQRVTGVNADWPVNLAPMAILKELAHRDPPPVIDGIPNLRSNSKAAKSYGSHRFFCTMGLPDQEDATQETQLVVSFPPKLLPRSLIGRVTRPFYAYDTKLKKIVFVKQYWRACKPGMEVEKEGSIYATLQQANVRNLAAFNNGNDVRNYATATSTIQERKPAWAAPTKEMVLYRLYRLSLKTLGRPLLELESHEKVLIAIRDAMISHDDAFFKAGVLHRDISAGNIMTDSDGTGFLIDWDLSVRVTGPRRSAARRPDRTATWQFLSVQLLQDPTAPQTIADDRESAFWVFIWVALRRMPHNNVPELASHWMKMFDTQAENIAMKSGICMPASKSPRDLHFEGVPFIRDFVETLAKVFSKRYQQPSSLTSPTQHSISQALTNKYKASHAHGQPEGEISIAQGSTQACMTERGELVGYFNVVLDRWDKKVRKEAMAAGPLKLHPLDRGRKVAKRTITRDNRRIAVTIHPIQTTKSFYDSTPRAHDDYDEPRTDDDDDTDSQTAPSKQQDTETPDTTPDPDDSQPAPTKERPPLRRLPLRKGCSHRGARG